MLAATVFEEARTPNDAEKPMRDFERRWCEGPFFTNLHLKKLRARTSTLSETGAKIQYTTTRAFVGELQRQRCVSWRRNLGILRVFEVFAQPRHWGLHSAGGKNHFCTPKRIHKPKQPNSKGDGSRNMGGGTSKALFFLRRCVAFRLLPRARPMGKCLCQLWRGWAR
ncbi:hypothetical protein TRVL_05542 [Trypanosoma vivax]|nr:hypothetical protein TRVL_05542 [Trypanosoma vivax]